MFLSSGIVPKIVYDVPFGKCQYWSLRTLKICCWLINPLAASSGLQIHDNNFVGQLLERERERERERENNMVQWIVKTSYAIDFLIGTLTNIVLREGERERGLCGVFA
jgi:hypothetical protein